MISFNNKPVSAAIPAFDEIVIPLSEQIMGESERSANLREAVSNVRTSIDKAIDAFANSQLAPAFLSNELIPLFRQVVEIGDQVPPLLKIIAKANESSNPLPLTQRKFAGVCIEQEEHCS